MLFAVEQSSRCVVWDADYWTDSSAKAVIASHATMTSAVAAPAATFAFSFNV